MTITPLFPLHDGSRQVPWRRGWNFAGAAGNAAWLQQEWWAAADEGDDQTSGENRLAHGQQLLASGDHFLQAVIGGGHLHGQLAFVNSQLGG